MSLSTVVDDLREHPHRERSFYEYPELYDFFHSRVLDRGAQVGLLERYEPEDADRVLEFGCGTGPLLERLVGTYDEVLGVDRDASMLRIARERVSDATVREVDFTEWSAADEHPPYDMAVLMGGMLHLTDDADVESFAANAADSLRDGGAFVTFFQPLTDDVENGSRDVVTVESERFVVERHSVSALSSSAGHYTTTYLFEITDKQREVDASMGTVFRGRFHDPARLEGVFEAAGFSDVETVDGDGPTTLHAVK